MARIYENLCYSCREKLGKLYQLRDEEQKHERIAVCKLCGSCGYYDRISYDPLTDGLKGRGRT
ncbi:MAG: hypothetical protein J6J18_03550 [Oscillospiraceae bacterium]|nr:hypothetical protein [Oscillospiraceae bacterium]